MKKISLFIILVFICGSCSLFEDDQENDNTPDLRALTAEEQELISCVNLFAFNIFNTIREENPSDNFFISPLSIDYALAMTMNGADGSTLGAIKETLYVEEMTDEEINQSYYSLTEFLLGLDKTVKLSIANSVWYRNDLTVLDTFTENLIMYYNAIVNGLDFSDAEAKDMINNWVEDETNGKITDLIDQIPAEAVMYLINAIYFKADWANRFNESLTQSGDFYLENGSTVTTDMMKSEGSNIQYYKDTNLELIDIPYGNGQFSMTILLPAKSSSIHTLYTLLTPSQFSEWIDTADSSTVQLKMPKFKIEYKKLLNNALISLGMGVAFGDSADLSRLFEEPLDLFISRVIHQAVIEVDERGSEAAAATVVEVELTAVDPNQPPLIVIDRPFIFLIREKHSNYILFAGQLMDPS